MLYLFDYDAFPKWVYVGFLISWASKCEVAGIVVFMEVKKPPNTEKLSRDVHYRKPMRMHNGRKWLPTSQ